MYRARRPSTPRLRSLVETRNDNHGPPFCVGQDAQALNVEEGEGVGAKTYNVTPDVIRLKCLYAGGEFNKARHCGSRGSRSARSACP